MRNSGRSRRFCRPHWNYTAERSARFGPWLLKCSLILRQRFTMGNKMLDSTKPGPKGCISPKTEAAKNTEDIKRDVGNLYLLAFLLTGRRDVSIDIAADAAVSEDNPNSFFAEWMRDWRRRLVIGKALTAIRDELADSARRTKRARVEVAAAWQRNWSARPVVTKADLERALLAIDVFPRAALLLLVFEGMRIVDVATLLNSDPALVKKAQVIGLQELTASLAPTQPRPVCRLAQSPQRSGRV
jgi:DNA-directed RNA polymerase specialized sigma24 family protein